MHDREGKTCYGTYYGRLLVSPALPHARLCLRQGFLEPMTFNSVSHS